MAALAISDSASAAADSSDCSAIIPCLSVEIYTRGGTSDGKFCCLPPYPPGCVFRQPPHRSGNVPEKVCYTSILCSWRDGKRHI